jgi:hypothetical protein
VHYVGYYTIPFQNARSLQHKQTQNTTLDTVLYKTINHAMNAAIILLYLQVYVAAKLVLFITVNRDVVKLRGKNKESEILISCLMEKETTV